MTPQYRDTIDHPKFKVSSQKELVPKGVYNNM